MTRRILAGQVDATVTFSMDTWHVLERIAAKVSGGPVEPETVAAHVLREFARRQPEHGQPAVKQETERRGAPRTVDRDRVRELHAAGLSDGQIAEQIGATSSGVCKVRKELGLPAIGTAADAERRRA